MPYSRFKDEKATKCLYPGVLIVSLFPMHFFVKHNVIKNLMIKLTYKGSYHVLPLTTEKSNFFCFMVTRRIESAHVPMCPLYSAPNKALIFGRRFLKGICTAPRSRSHPTMSASAVAREAPPPSPEINPEDGERDAGGDEQGRRGGGLGRRRRGGYCRRWRRYLARSTHGHM